MGERKGEERGDNAYTLPPRLFNHSDAYTMYYDLRLMIQHFL